MSTHVALSVVPLFLCSFLWICWRYMFIHFSHPDLKIVCIILLWVSFFLPVHCEVKTRVGELMSPTLGSVTDSCPRAGPLVPVSSESQCVSASEKQCPLKGTGTWEVPRIAFVCRSSEYMFELWTFSCFPREAKCIHFCRWVPYAKLGYFDTQTLLQGMCHRPLWPCFTHCCC